MDCLPESTVGNSILFHNNLYQIFKFTLFVLSGPRLDGGLASAEAFRDTIGRYAEVGVTDFVVHWPRPEEPYAADLATFERIFSS